MYLLITVQVGRIIGKGGANVRELQRLTGAVGKKKLLRVVWLGLKGSFFYKYKMSSFLVKFPSAVSENNGGSTNTNATNTNTNTTNTNSTPVSENTSVHIQGSFYSVQVCVLNNSIS